MPDFESLHRQIIPLGELPLLLGGPVAPLQVPLPFARWPHTQGGWFRLDMPPRHSGARRGLSFPFLFFWKTILFFLSLFM